MELSCHLSLSLVSVLLSTHLQILYYSCVKPAYVYDILEKKKNKKTCRDRNRHTDYKWTQETFCNLRNALYLDLDGGYMTVYVCQNSHNGMLKRVNFTGYKLYLDKYDFQKPA